MKVWQVDRTHSSVEHSSAAACCTLSQKARSLVTEDFAKSHAKKIINYYEPYEPLNTFKKLLSFPSFTGV
jgi:hypothetical protein